MNGGGNFGDLYPHHQRLREAIVAAFPIGASCSCHKPLYFRVRIVCAVCSPHGPASGLHVFARDRESLTTLPPMGLANCSLHIELRLRSAGDRCGPSEYFFGRPEYDVVHLLRRDIEGGEISLPMEGMPGLTG